MKTYQSIRAEIAKLEKHAESLRARELRDVIGKIKHAIAVYGLSAADLGLAGGAAVPAQRRKPGPKPGAKAKGRAGRSIGAPMYRDPKSGATWTGRGRAPNWILGVKNRDEYLIAASAAAPELPGVAVKRRRSAAKKTAGKRSKTQAMVKTPAVQIESGVASE